MQRPNLGLDVGRQKGACSGTCSSPTPELAWQAGLCEDEQAEKGYLFWAIPQSATSSSRWG